MNRYVVIVQAPDGYPNPADADQADLPAPPMLHEAVLLAPVTDYIDDAIKRWRQVRDSDDARADVARCYVDAFQSMRVSIVGAPLPL